MAHPIIRLLSTDVKRVVGLMSGTSLDGIDAALVDVSGWGTTARVELRRFLTVPFTPSLRSNLERLLDPERPSAAAEVSSLSFRLGAAHAEAALAVAGDDKVDLIGSHGQTVWHQPPWMKTRDDLPASTLQIGEPAVIAARTGCVTVGDFRVADVALSGEGAPLVPYADWVLFRKPGALRGLQNIGGIANITVVGDHLADTFAFDTGPGNMIADAIATLVSAGVHRFDRDGALSARGQVQDDVLAILLDDDYLHRPPPKSTGRERYGRPFVERYLDRFRDRTLDDLLATAVAFTAESIARAIRSFVLPRLGGRALDELLVSGGGAHNRTLMARLERLLAPIPVREFHDAGVPADAKEAVSFALLAVEAIHASPANVPAATGARGPAILGKICLPPPG